MFCMNPGVIFVPKFLLFSPLKEILHTETNPLQLGGKDKETVL